MKNEPTTLRYMRGGSHRSQQSVERDLSDIDGAIPDFVIHTDIEQVVTEFHFKGAEVIPKRRGNCTSVQQGQSSRHRHP